MIQLAARYKYVFGLLAVYCLIGGVNPDIGVRSYDIATASLLEMLIFLPPVFLLLGLFDVWVPREAIIKVMGRDSGLLGILLAFLLGSFAAGPLYAAFPIAAVLLEKGCKYSNIWIFVGAWSTTKVPMLLFEAGAMGVQYMLLRLLINIPGIIIMAFLIERLSSDTEKQHIKHQIT